ncbi:MAG: 2-octaprenyl-6-methoxyphenyl hydroxylase [Granulosicoccus sp.]|nr:2-octaprenyl-6-methoxyphenyl hydroxylase [Granulosicoccus sp.]
MNSQPDITDVVIAGAGLVGTPLAQVLAANGWDVVLLDAGEAASRSSAAAVRDAPVSAGPDRAATPWQAHERVLRQRCTALSLGTQQWFAQHALWSAVADDAAPIRQVNVTQKGYFGATRLRADELHVEALGYVVDNANFTQVMRSMLAAQGVAFHSGARVVAVREQASFVEVHLADGPPFRARLLLAVDGVSSAVRESAGIGRQQTDYGQAAALSIVKLEDAHHGVAHERFTDTGPLAFLPRTGPYMSVVDCMEPAERSTIDDLDDAAYLARLQARFGYRLGRFEAVGPRLTVPLLRIEASAQTATRTVLLGNAMRLLHPVGGQGYNLAMRDVACLVRLLGTNRGADPGEADLLRHFVEARRNDQRQVVRFTETLARGFRGRAALPGHVRSAVLLGLDTLGPLRTHFARRTMGLTS